MAQSIKHKFYLMTNSDCINISLPFQVIESQLVACKCTEKEGDNFNFHIKLVKYHIKAFFFFYHHTFLQLVYLFSNILSSKTVNIKISTGSHFKQQRNFLYTLIMAQLESKGDILEIMFFLPSIHNGCLPSTNVVPHRVSQCDLPCSLRK